MVVEAQYAETPNTAINIAPEAINNKNTKAWNILLPKYAYEHIARLRNRYHDEGHEKITSLNI